MGFLSRLFKEKQTEITYQNESIIRLMDFLRFFWRLKTSDDYISRKAYIQRLKEEEENVRFFQNLKSNRLLETFCREEQFASKNVDFYLELFANFPTLIEEINHDYVKRHLESEKAYFDELFKAVDESIVLDEEQRIAILTDEDYCLLIAGAGSGKTTTIWGRLSIYEKQWPQRHIIHFLHQQSG